MRRLLTPIALLAAPVAAQTADTTRTVDQLAECRAVPADADRLRCFDRLAERITAARSSGDLLVLDRRQVVERKRRAFGLTGPARDAFTTTGEVAAVTELNTSIQAIGPTPTPGRWNLQLADGTVWQSVDTLPFPPRKGSAVKVRTASLGGFRASIEGGRSFLVKRLR